MQIVKSLEQLLQGFVASRRTVLQHSAEILLCLSAQEMAVAVCKVLQLCLLSCRRTDDSDARLRVIIGSARCHDMVPEVLARLRIPFLVQVLYQHPNK